MSDRARQKAEALIAEARARLQGTSARRADADQWLDGAGSLGTSMYTTEAPDAPGSVRSASVGSFQSSGTAGERVSAAQGRAQPPALPTADTYRASSARLPLPATAAPAALSTVAATDLAYSVLGRASPAFELHAQQPARSRSGSIPVGASMMIVTPSALLPAPGRAPAARDAARGSGGGGFVDYPSQDAIASALLADVAAAAAAAAGAPPPPPPPPPPPTMHGRAPPAWGDGGDGGVMVSSSSAGGGGGWIGTPRSASPTGSVHSRLSERAGGASGSRHLATSAAVHSRRHSVASVDAADSHAATAASLTSGSSAAAPAHSSSAHARSRTASVSSQIFDGMQYASDAADVDAGAAHYGVLEGVAAPAAWHTYGEPSPAAAASHALAAHRYSAAQPAAQQTRTAAHSTPSAYDAVHPAAATSAAASYHHEHQHSHGHAQQQPSELQAQLREARHRARELRQRLDEAGSRIDQQRGRIVELEMMVSDDSDRHVRAVLALRADVERLEAEKQALQARADAAEASMTVSCRNCPANRARYEACAAELVTVAESARSAERLHHAVVAARDAAEARAAQLVHQCSLEKQKLEAAADVFRGATRDIMRKCEAVEDRAAAACAAAASRVGLLLTTMAALQRHNAFQAATLHDSRAECDRLRSGNASLVATIESLRAERTAADAKASAAAAAAAQADARRASEHSAEAAAAAERKESECQQLRQELDTQKWAASKLQEAHAEQLRQMNGRIAQLQSAVALHDEQLAAAAESAAAGASDAQQRIAALADDLASADTAVAALREELERLHREGEELRAERAAGSQRQQLLASEAAQLRHELAVLRQSVVAAVEQHAIDVDAAATALRDVKARMHQRDAANQALTAQVGQLQAALDEAITAAATADEKAESATQEALDLAELCNEATRVSTQQQEQLEQAARDADAAAQEIAGLQAKAARLQEEHAAELQRTRADHEQRAAEQANELLKLQEAHDVDVQRLQRSLEDAMVLITETRGILREQAAALEAQRGNTQAAEAARDTLRSQLQAAEAALQQLRTDHEEALQRLAGVQRDKTDADQRAMAMEATVVRASTQLESLLAVASSEAAAQQRVMQLTTINEQLGRDLAVERSEATATRNQLTVLQDNFKSVADSELALQRRVFELEAQLGATSGSSERAESHIAALQATLADKSEKLAALDAAHMGWLRQEHELRSQIAALQVQLSQAQHELEGAQVGARALEHDGAAQGHVIRSLQDEIGLLRRDVVASDDARQELQRQLEAARAQTQRLQADVDSERAKAAALEHSYRAAADDAQHLARQVSELQEDAAHISAAAADVDVQELQRHLHQVTEELGDLKDALEVARARCTELEAANMALAEDHRAMAEQATDADARAAENETAYQQASEEVVALRAELAKVADAASSRARFDESFLLRGVSGAAAAPVRPERVAVRQPVATIARQSVGGGGGATQRGFAPVASTAPRAVPRPLAADACGVANDDPTWTS